MTIGVIGFYNGVLSVEAVSGVVVFEFEGAVGSRRYGCDCWDCYGDCLCIEGCGGQEGNQGALSLEGSADCRVACDSLHGSSDCFC